MSRLVLAALALGLALPAAAQTARERAATYPAVNIEQWGNDESPDPSRLRRASAGDSVRDWFTLEDPEIQTQVLYGGQGYSTASLRLEITPGGRVSGCRVTWSNGDARWPTGLCDRIRERARFRPAIDVDGAPVGDVVQITVDYNTSSRPRSPLVQIGSGAPPVVVPVERPSWPPVPGPRASVSGLDRLRGGPDAPEASGAPWAGVTVHPAKTGTSVFCEVSASSGDADFDRRACAAAEAGGYNFSFLHPSRRRIGLLFVLQDDTPRALLPLESTSGANIEHQSLAAIADQLIADGHDLDTGLRVFVTAGPNGRAVRCEVTRSSGSDALDVAACRLIRKDARFTIARDVFGRPVEDGMPITFPPAL